MQQDVINDLEVKMEKWRVEWRAIEDRISGLKETASMLLTAVGVNKLGYQTTADYALRPVLIEVMRTMVAFSDVHGAAIPQLASDRLKAGLARVCALIGHDESHWRRVVWQAAFNATVILFGLRAEVSASLVDNEAVGRRHVERAFEHLQRSIVVDESYRSRWRDAYNEGETNCERLGAVHLLLHGIWAFKAHAEGERTDLVLQEKLAISKAERVADTLVLTEWKLAKARREVTEKAGEGKRQAKVYSASSLAAIELGAIRYVVVVTERREQVPDDEQDAAITYRFINIAVNPDSPSVTAQTGGGRRPGTQVDH